MRFIPTLFHGVVDYAVGAFVLAMPFLFELVGSPRLVFAALGLGVIVISLLTDYELGWARVISLKLHLAIDAAFGLAMLASPWLLGLEGAVAVVAMCIGAMALVFASFTRRARNAV